MFEKFSPEDQNSKKLDFEELYARKEFFNINDAEVEAVDIKPENKKSETPVLVAPGFAATIDSFKPGIKVLVDKGRETLCLNHPRKGGIIPETSNSKIENNHSEELRKAHNILGLLNQKGLDKIDVIAHSEASINVCIAAMLHPERFRNIVLYSPAGLIGNDTLFRLIKGVVTHPKRPETMSDYPVTESEKKYLDDTVNIGPEYQKANPLRAVKEVYAISQAQIQDMLKYLRDKGIKIVVISGVDDTFFPMDKMQKNVNTSMVDGFLSVKGGHMQIQTHPELFMSLAEEMISTLERNSNKKRS